MQTLTPLRIFERNTSRLLLASVYPWLVGRSQTASRLNPSWVRDKPLVLALILTHNLQWDLLKRPSRRDARTDCFTSTSLVTGFTSLPQKMWVRIRALAMGYLTVSLPCVENRVVYRPVPARH